MAIDTWLFHLFLSTNSDVIVYLVLVLIGDRFFFSFADLSAGML
jgi:hypothetical protein